MSTHTQKRGGSGPALLDMSVHLDEETEVEVRAYPHTGPGPFVAVEVGSYPGRVGLLFHDLELLDQLRWALDEAHKALVAAQDACASEPRRSTGRSVA